MKDVKINVSFTIENMTERSIDNDLIQNAKSLLNIVLKDLEGCSGLFVKKTASKGTTSLKDIRESYEGTYNGYVKIKGFQIDNLNKEDIQDSFIEADITLFIKIENSRDMHSNMLSIDRIIKENIIGQKDNGLEFVSFRKGEIEEI